MKGVDVGDICYLRLVRRQTYPIVATLLSLVAGDRTGQTAVTTPPMMGPAVFACFAWGRFERPIFSGSS